MYVCMYMYGDYLIDAQVCMFVHEYVCMYVCSMYMYGLTPRCVCLYMSMCLEYIYMCMYVNV
jgi:hypothetical protein